MKFQKKIRLTNTHITSRIAIKLAEKNGGMDFNGLNCTSSNGLSEPKKMRILKIVGVISELPAKQHNQSSQKLFGLEFLQLNEYETAP